MNTQLRTAPKDAGSFRDPGGRLYRLGDRVVRAVNSTGLGDLETFFACPQTEELLVSGKVIGTRRIAPVEARDLADNLGPCAAFLEHDRVAFPSYPYEWPPEMLYEAAALTLELALRLQPADIGLKDATPYNVLFRGPAPVFVDILSFERREPGDASWLAYAQFVRTFLLPLLAYRHFGMPPHQFFLSRRDGLEPEEVYRWAGPLQKLRPSFFSLVSMPTWLGAGVNRTGRGMYQRTAGDDREKAQYVLRSLFRGLHHRLGKLRPQTGGRSRWSDYLASNNNYSAGHFGAKKDFVERALEEFRPRRVLDVGCNTGVFSATAARTGARVVAIDSDPVVVGQTWRRAHEQRLDILPLVVDLARPTPAVGWRNAECPSFLDRSHSAFDAVLMLAVIHHMLVTDRIPLAEIAGMAAALTTDLLIVEFVAPQDSMFASLTRGRDELYRDLDTGVFEACFRAYFEIVRIQHLEGAHRWLYVMRKRPGHA